MANYLSVMIECPDENFARQAYEQLHRDTRALFDDDVPAGSEDIYRAVEDLEFPDTQILEGRRLWLTWREDESVQVDSLSHLLALEGVRFVAGFEVPDYADCADDDDPFEDDHFGLAWYWIPGGEGQRIRRFPVSEAADRLAEELVVKLRGGD